MSRAVTPLLKSADWAEQRTENGLLLFPLNAQITPAGAPWVVYGLDQGKSVAFLPASESNQQNLPQIQAAALASLRQRLSTLNWERLGENDRLKNVLAFAGGFNAAECLLLPERLQEAHAIVQSASMLACTPKRGLLLVWPYVKEEKQALEAFVELCHRLYYAEDDESISPVIWGVVDGEIKDAMNIDTAYLAYLQTRYSSDEPRAAAPTLVNQEQGSTVESAKRLYSLGQIVFMSLFGTILAGLYGMYKNYKALGAISAARNTVLAALVLVPGNFWLFMEVPYGAYEKLFPLLPAVFMGVVGKLLQGKALKAALADGALPCKVWNQCLVIAGSLLVMLPLVAILITLLPSS